MIQLARDNIGADPLFLLKVHTDLVHALLEALVNAKSSPPGVMQIVGDENGIMYKFNILAGLPPLLFALQVQDATHVRVTVSQLAGDLPTGFVGDDSTPFVLTVAGNGVIYAEVTYDNTDGSISSRDIKQAATLPADDDTHTRALLGNFITAAGVLSATNTAYGPVNSDACQQPFTAGLPYKVRLFPAGLTVSG